MGDVIKFNGDREPAESFQGSDHDFVIHDDAPSEPHMHGPAVCMLCRHEWEGVAPVGVTQIECPECGTQKGVFVYPMFAADRPHWRCPCGNEFFVIHDDHFLCAHCGVHQRFG